MSFHFKFTANFHTNLSSALSKSVMYPSKSVIKYDMRYRQISWEEGIRVSDGGLTGCMPVCMPVV